MVELRETLSVELNDDFTPMGDGAGTSTANNNAKRRKTGKMARLRGET